MMKDEIIILCTSLKIWTNWNLRYIFCIFYRKGRRRFRSNTIFRLNISSVDLPKQSIWLLQDTQNCRLRMHRECRERFLCHRGLVIPTRIRARAWRTCRDACWDRKLAVSFKVCGGENVPGMLYPQFCVSGKRLILCWNLWDWARLCRLVSGWRAAQRRQVLGHVNKCLSINTGFNIDFVSLVSAHSYRRGFILISGTSILIILENWQLMERPKLGL